MLARRPLAGPLCRLGGGLLRLGQRLDKRLELGVSGPVHNEAGDRLKELAQQAAAIDPAALDHPFARVSTEKISRSIRGYSRWCSGSVVGHRQQTPLILRRPLSLTPLFCDVSRSKKQAFSQLYEVLGRGEKSHQSPTRSVERILRLKISRCGVRRQRD
jgi:hypothetical protein